MSGRGGLVIVILVLAAGGALAWAVIGGATEQLVVASVLIMLLPGVGLALLRPLLRSRALMEQGQPGEATVLEVRDTGWTVNESPRVGLRLEVQPAGEPPFEAEVKVIVPRLLVPDLRPGAVLQVRYDPKNRRRVAVLLEEGMRGGPAGRLQELEALRERGLVTPEEYERKHREIVDVL